MRTAAGRRRRRAGPVGGQRELVGQFAQCRGPELQLPVSQRPGVVPVSQQLAVPSGVVGVADRQRSPGRQVAPTAGVVGSAEVSDQGAHRPFVGRDVVHEQQQHRGVRRERERVRTKRQLVRQIERARGRRLEVGGECLVVAGDPVRLDVRVRGIEYPLAPRAVDLGVARPQALVPVDQIVEGGTQSLAVELTGESDGERDVVRGVGTLGGELEQQPLLGVRDGRPSG